MKKFMLFLFLVWGAVYEGHCALDHKQPAFVRNIWFPEEGECTTLECKKSPVLILSIDGASVRGLAQLYILQALEGMLRSALQLPNLRLTDVFNLYAGTSAGAINTVALLTPSNVVEGDSQNAVLPIGTFLIPRYSLNRPVANDEKGAALLDQEIEKLDVSSPAFLDDLRERGAVDLTAAANLLIGKTFKQTLATGAHKLRVFFGVTGARFKHETLENMLKGITTMKVINKQKAAIDEGRVYYRMSDTVKPAILTAWDARNRDLFLFSTFDACQHPNDKPENARNKEMWFAARTASAGPTYFNPTELVEDIGAEKVHRILMDAGLIVMSPALLGLAEAMRIYPGRRYVIVSLSGGVMGAPREGLETKGVHAAGMDKILKPAIEGAVEGGPKVAEHVLSLMPNVLYLRVNFEVNNTRFEDASDENIIHIKQAAANAIVSEEFKTIVNAVAKAYREQEIKKDISPYKKCVFPADALMDESFTRKKKAQNVWNMSIDIDEPPLKRAKTGDRRGSQNGTIKESIYAEGRPVSMRTIPLNMGPAS